MKKTYYHILCAIFVILAVLSDTAVCLAAFSRKLSFWVLFFLLAAMHAALFFCLWFYLYRPQKILKEAVADYNSLQDFDAFLASVSPCLSEEILNILQDLKHQKIDFADSQKQAEYLALQNQINPHFLYNTLEALRGDTLYEGLKTVSSVIEALATFFRYTITDTGNLTTIENELDHTENYFIIQKYRFGDKINMTVLWPDDKNEILTLLLPKLTLQPIIENSIFHGLEKKSGNGEITISIETTERFLFINVSDTGIGMQPDTLHRINDSLENLAKPSKSGPKQEHQSIALQNVARRIKLLFGSEFGLHLYSTPGIGTDVRIILPKIQKRNLTL